VKRSHKTAAAIVAALSLGVAVAAFAQPGPMGDGNGPHGNAGMQHGKMHSAKTPEERQKPGQTR